MAKVFDIAREFAALGLTVYELLHTIRTVDRRIGAVWWNTRP
ncbi:hypothetical protein ACVILL_000376 [Bradyrhizobium sp. USDA 3364]